MCRNRTTGTVGAFGLTIRTNATLKYGPVNRSGEQERENRIVPVFDPWHRVEYVRLAEPEKKYGRVKAAGGSVG